MSDTDWEVERLRGSAAELHGRALPEVPRPAIWWLEVARPALVLGSTQPWEVADGPALARAGTDLARRHSGGGAVLVVPGAVTWVDVILPATDPRWSDDVGVAFHWLGRAWARALSELRVPAATVHEGPPVRTRWSPVACFAGLGAGEVTVAGRKVLGISQRRTRTMARFQCVLVHAWDPRQLADLLALERSERGRLVAALEVQGGAVGPRDPGAVVEALHHAVSDPHR